MITPTIGRKVWYRPLGYSEGAVDSNQPFDATVVHVWSDICVNLVIRDHVGNQFTKTSVSLAQDREAQPGECEWMPYQKGQAARVESEKQ